MGLGVWEGTGLCALILGVLLRKNKRHCLIALRGASGAFLLSALWPGWGRLSDAPPLAVVWDDSASMGSRVPGTQETRWDRARRAWDRLAFFGAGPVRHFLLSDDLRETTVVSLSSAVPRGLHSRLGKAVGVTGLAPEVRGVVLFSDGQSEEIGSGGETLSGLGVPVLALGASAEPEVFDVAVAEVRPSRLAFSGEETEIGVRLTVRGASDARGSVALWENGRERARATWSGISGEAWEGVLRFRPSGVGVRRCRVEVTTEKDEFQKANNRREFLLDVARGRLRVLYLCGRPGPHYGFLRSQLKLDPAVELVSFVILRDPDDAVGVPESELSLIPFPSPETLLRQLSTFDVILLENFPLRSFGLGSRFAEALLDRVRRGGGLMVSGEGPYWRSGGPALGTALASLFPAENVFPGVPGRWTAAPVHPSHPVVSLGTSESETLRRWRESPVLESNGADPWPSLAEGSPLLVGPGGTPYLSSRVLGRGRILLLAGLTDWRWSLAGGTHGPWFYQRFWENVVRWLGQSSDRSSLRWAPPEGPVPVGEPISFSARWLGDGAPAQVTVTAKNEAGSAFRGRMTPTGGGDFVGRWSFPTPSLYELEARVGDERDLQMVSVGPTWDESADPRPRFDVLERLAGTSGGKAFPVDEISPREFRRWIKSLERSSVSDRTGSLLSVAAAVLVFAAEWFRRRKWGEP